MKKLFENPKIIFAAAFTIGLAPFFPEPHVWGKLKWVLGGAVGMQPMDWFDLIMHGTPWLLVIAWLIYYFYNLLNNSSKSVV
jgi:hypothetical protein